MLSFGSLGSDSHNLLWFLHCRHFIRNIFNNIFLNPRNKMYEKQNKMH